MEGVGRVNEVGGGREVGRVNEGVGRVNEGVGRVNEEVRGVNEGVGRVNEGVGRVNEGVGRVNEGVNGGRWEGLMEGVGRAFSPQETSEALHNMGTTINMLTVVT